MQRSDVITLVLERNAYYRKLYLYALAAFVLGVCVIVGLSVALMTIVRIPKEALYFPTDSAGRLIDEMPLNQPNMPIEKVKAWVAEAVENSSTFNFVNYRAQLQYLSGYFTDYGWSSFRKALSMEGTIQAVTLRKWIMTARVSGDITLVQQGYYKGHYAWKFTLPLLVMTWGPPYDDRSRGFTPLKVTVVVIRQPLLQSYQGLGILQYYSYNAASAPLNEDEMMIDQSQ